MGIPFITMDAHNIVNDNVAQGCGYQNNGQIVEISAEGSVVSFETNVAAPLVSLEAQIVAQQSGSGTPSPTNIRPISGFDKVIITNNDINTEIDLPETVYGGKLNVTTGELFITHSIIDMGSLQWIYIVAARRFWAPIPNMKRPCDLLCESYVQSSALRLEDMADFEIWNRGFAYNDKNIIVTDSNYTESSSFKKAVNGIHLVYELAEPVTIQLTPTEINTIIGRNNISANTGDVALTYIRVNK